LQVQFLTSEVDPKAHGKLSVALPEQALHCVQVVPVP
jgi:hypothetical protein